MEEMPKEPTLAEDPDLFKLFQLKGKKIKVFSKTSGSLVEGWSFHGDAYKDENGEFVIGVIKTNNEGYISTKIVKVSDLLKWNNDL